MALMLTEINSHFKNIRDFVFATGYWYEDILAKCSNILEKSANSLENFLLLYNTIYLHLLGFNRIFEKLYYGVFPKLKSLRLEFGLEILLQSTHERIIALERLRSLRDFGFFWCNPSIKVYDAKIGVKLISEIMVQINSVEFCLQTNFTNYTKDDMDEILSILFLTKSENLRYFSLGVGSDQGKLITTTQFTLDHFGKILKGNEWYLLKFNLYYEVNHGVSQQEIRGFLLILFRHLKFLVEAQVQLMSIGKDLLEEYGFNGVIEKYFNEKKSAIMMTIPMRRLKKCFRREILNEILEKCL